jgi:hypothetical protein
MEQRMDVWPTPEQWRQYYIDLAAQCGGEIPIGCPAITQWVCERGTDNATVEGERRRCTNKACHILRIK